MATKFLALIVILAYVAQGQALTEITLPDVYHTFITNPIIGKTIAIPKFFFDTLESCHVILPNGQVVEAFPNNRLTTPNVFFLEAVQPFVSCGIGFVGAEVSQSGIYELMSMVHHTDDSRSLTRQRFHMTFVLSEVEFPTK